MSDQRGRTPRERWTDLDVLQWVDERMCPTSGRTVTPVPTRWSSAMRSATHGPADGPSRHRLVQAHTAGLIEGETVTRRPWGSDHGTGAYSPVIELHLRITPAGREMLNRRWLDAMAGRPAS